MSSLYDTLIPPTFGFILLLGTIALGLIWRGVHFRFDRSMRIRVELKHLQNRLSKPDQGFSLRYLLVQIREYCYETFGGSGLVGQMLVVIFTITSILGLAYITAEISRMGIGVLQLAPFDSSMIVTLWQVQATVVTLAFVVSIFFWESLLSETPYNEVLRLFIRYTHSLFGVTFSLTATATSGLLLLHQSTPGTDTDRLPLFIGYAVILLSTSTYLLVIWMFRRTAGILVYGEDEKLISDIARLGIDKELTWGKRDIERRLREQWWGTSQTIPVTAFTQKEVTEFKANSLNMTGVITDLDLIQIKRLVELAESEGLTVEAIPQIGRNLDAAQNATLFAVEGEVTEDLKKDIESTVGSAVVTRQRKGFKW